MHSGRVIASSVYVCQQPTAQFQFVLLSTNKTARMQAGLCGEWSDSSSKATESDMANATIGGRTGRPHYQRGPVCERAARLTRLEYNLKQSAYA